MEEKDELIKSEVESEVLENCLDCQQTEKKSKKNIVFGIIILAVIIIGALIFISTSNKYQVPDNIVEGITNNNPNNEFDNTIRGLADGDLEFIGEVYAVTNSRDEIVLQGIVKNNGNDIGSFAMSYDLLDESGDRIRTVSAYVQVLPGNGNTWHFAVPTNGIDFASFELNSINGVMNGLGTIFSVVENSVNTKDFEIIQKPEILTTESGSSVGIKIKNNSGVDAYTTRLVVLLFDDKGNMIDVTFEFLNMFEKDGIWYYVGDSTRYDVASVEIYALDFHDFRVEQGDPVDNVEFEIVKDLQISETASGNIFIEGEIKNISGNDAGYARMFISLYNQDGEIVGEELVTSFDFTDGAIWSIYSIVWGSRDVHSARITLIQNIE